MSYGYPWADLIGRLKFGGDTASAAPLARLLANVPGACAALGAADLLVPMPLAAERLQARGYNQATLLARALRRLAGGPVCDGGLLLRTRHTPAQTELDRSARLANVRGAFAVAPLRAADVGGRRIVLLDDVMTSGASLAEASTALRQAGAAHIAVLVAARTEPA